VNPSLRDALSKAVRRHGHPVWLVGGPLRDRLLGVECKDWDFVCRSARSLAQKTARHLRAKFIVLDDEFRIYRVILPDHQTLDFAELQGKSLEADLCRRDFSINAMAQRFPQGPLIDLFKGERDLQKRVIRSTSESVFKEDPLRTLRTFRFTAQIQGHIDPRTLVWVRKYRRGLLKVSAERVREELLRLWKQPVSANAVRWMDKAGLLTIIFPEMEACRRTAVSYYGRGGVLKHSFETLENLEWILLKGVSPAVKEYLDGFIGGYPRKAWLKWAAFLHDIGKPATAQMMKGRLRFFEHEHVGAELSLKISKRLRLSRQESHLIALWVRNHMRTGSLAAAPRVTDKALSRFFRDLGEEGVGMVLLSLADHYTYLKKSLWNKGKDPVEKMGRKLLSSYFEERSKILPEKVVNGHDLMRAFKIKPGPKIGRLLEAIQDAQAEGKVSTKEEALRFAKRKLRL
jgi:putative nucleotidyltransferase with HDIG domain